MRVCVCVCVCACTRAHDDARLRVRRLRIDPPTRSWGGAIRSFGRSSQDRFVGVTVAAFKPFFIGPAPRALGLGQKNLFLRFRWRAAQAAAQERRESGGQQTSRQRRPSPAQTRARLRARRRAFGRQARRGTRWFDGDGGGLFVHEGRFPQRVGRQRRVRLRDAGAPFMLALPSWMESTWNSFSSRRRRPPVAASVTASSRT